MKVVVGIPSRMGSTRFPGKPLCDIAGMPMIEHCYKRCSLSKYTTDLFVAACDEEIESVVLGFGGKVIMTDPSISRPGLRVAAAAETLDLEDDDIVVVVQGDEPLIEPSDISLIIEKYMESPGKCYCGMSKITNEEDFYNPNIPKVVSSSCNKLIYISRAAIPTTKKLDMIEAKKQVCIYAFTKDSLKEYGLNSKKEENENIEDIEILRLIERGYEVEMVEVSDSSIAVDTPEDLKRVIDYLDEL